MPRFPAATGATAVEVRQEIDANSTRLDADMSSRAPSGEYNTEMARVDVDVSSRNATTPPTVAAVRTEMDSNSTKLAHLTQDVTVGIKKGVEYTLVFKMVDATDFATPETGITVIEEISKDGGVFTACTNAFAEIANGWYKITLTATEMNANEIIFKGTDAGCAQCDRLIITEA
jgi:hypothetical protein